MKTYDRLIAKAEKVRRCLNRLILGDSVRSIVLEEDVWYNQLQRWAEESEVPFKPGSRGRPKGHSIAMMNRIVAMRNLRHRGMTFRSISEEFGISTQRVQELLK